MKRLFFLIFLVLSGCTGIPDNITAVEGFEIERYLGTWYEIARLDHSFERGLSHVKATYTLREDGGIDVVNRGFHREDGKWEEARGKAYFVSDPGVGRLKVSFFGPFFGAYNIIALDKENYGYSMVCGPSRSYLWVLARRKTVHQEVLSSLLFLARDLGFETDKLIYVDHGDVPQSAEGR